MYVHDVASAKTVELPDIGSNAAVCCLGADRLGHVWLGHAGGLVQVWCAVHKHPICRWSSMSQADIR